MTHIRFSSARSSKLFVGSKPLIACAFLVLSGFYNTAQAMQTFWENESLDFTSQAGDGSFDCAGCHSGIDHTSSLQMSVPDSVAFDATAAPVGLSGFNAGNKLSSWRYQIVGGSAVAPINGVRPGAGQSSTSEQISFNVSDSPIVVRYCLVDADGANSRRWNCGSKSIERLPEPNEPPNITSANPGDLNIQEGESFSFSVTATDDKTLPVLEVVSSHPTIVSVSDDGGGNYTLSTGLLAGARITITATDSDGATDEQAFNVRVNAFVPENEPPVITSANPGNQSLFVGENFSFPATATDDRRVSSLQVSTDNTDVLTVSITGLNIFTLTAHQPGSTSVRIRAIDSDGVSVRQVFKVVVEEAPIIVPPVVDLPPVLNVANLPERLELLLADNRSFAVSISDEDLDTLTLSASSSNEQIVLASFNASGNAAGRLIIEARQAGEATITMEARDSAGQTVIVSVLVAVSKANTAPVAVADSYVLGDGDVRLSLDVLANDSDADADALSIVLDSPTSSLGSSVTVSGKTVIYQAESALTENDVFTYRAVDPQGAHSASVSVTLSASDSDGDGVVDAQDNCPVLVNANQGDMDTDGIGDVCDVDPDGDGQPGVAGMALESGEALATEQCLTCHRVGTAGAPLFNDEATWNARIAEAGGKPEDLLDSVRNGRGLMPAFGSRYSTQKLLEAILYLTGRENIGNEIPEELSDLDQDGVADDDDNCPSVPNAGQADSDANQIGDLCEPLADKDNDGYVFQVDDDDSNANRMIATLPVVTNATVFTSDAGLRLGRVGAAESAAGNSQQAALILTSSDFAQYAEQVFPGISVAQDSNFSSLMGVINVVANTTSGKAEIIIHLSSNLPLNPVFRMFEISSGAWRSFDGSGSDQVYSAAAISGGCPLPGSANYHAGLTVGLPCLRIVLSDGGIHDADGASNGQVELMINIASSLLNDGSNTVAEVDTNPSKGGGAAGISLLALLLMMNIMIKLGEKSGRRR